MAFTASLIQITLRYLNLGQHCQTARCYSWDGVSIAAASPDQVGEAWWNHYKTAWRDLAPETEADALFQTVLVREVGGGLAYGEYAIPVEEQAGLRGAVPGYGQAPSYVACGVRLTVGSALTRPGQLRIPFLNTADIVGNLIGGDFLEFASELADLYSQPNILGTPVATGVITPQVTRFGVDNDTVAATQDIVGFVVNGVVTSQVSRRAGHGN